MISALASIPRTTGKPDESAACCLPSKLPQTEASSTPPVCHSGVLDLCFSLLQVGVDRTSDQFCDRAPVTLERVCNLAIWPDLTNSALKHSICVLLWQETHDLNAIQDHVGHRSSSSTLIYLRADAALKAQMTLAGMSFSEATQV